MDLNFVSFAQAKGNPKHLEVVQLTKEQISAAAQGNNWVTFVTQKGKCSLSATKADLRTAREVKQAITSWRYW